MPKPNAETSGKKAAISPLTIIILVVAIGAAAYLLIPSGQPTEVPQLPTTDVKPNSIPKSTLATNGSELQKTVPSQSPIEPDLEPSSKTASSGRNPFSPTFSLTRYTKNLDSGSKVVAVSKEVKVEVLPIWRGKAKTGSRQVAIIEYSNKAYLLKVGDRLPGTDYSLIEIKSNTVVLRSPAGIVELTRKREIKK